MCPDTLQCPWNQGSSHLVYLLSREYSTYLSPITSNMKETVKHFWSICQNVNKVLLTIHHEQNIFCNSIIFIGFLFSSLVYQISLLSNNIMTSTHVSILRFYKLYFEVSFKHVLSLALTHFQIQFY